MKTNMTGLRRDGDLIGVANHSLHLFTELVCQKFEAIQYLPNTKIISRVFR